MSRKIKFRAWDGENMRVMNSMYVGVGQIGFSDEHYVDLNEVDQEQVELMQYTGLKDKNGVEVYEGDFVATLDGILEVQYETHRVWAAFNFVHPTRGIWRGAEGFEVIGNIYENPELLTA